MDVLSQKEIDELIKDTKIDSLEINDSINTGINDYASSHGVSGTIYIKREKPLERVYKTTKRSDEHISYICEGCKIEMEKITIYFGNHVKKFGISCTKCHHALITSKIIKDKTGQWNGVSNRKSR